MKAISRRDLLKFVALGGSAAVLAACAPKVVTQVVKETVVVEKVVQSTVVVPKEVTKVVEKEVTKVVEKAVPAAKEPIVLTIQHVHPTYFDFGEKTVDPPFQDKHPGVTIKREMTPGYTRAFYPKLIAMHVAGTAWDCAELPSDVGFEYQLYLKGVLKDLTPFVERDKFDLGKFWPIAIQSCKYKSQALPFLPILIDPGQGVLLYNKALLKEAGIDEPNVNWTYELEYKDALAKAKKAFANKKGIFLWEHHATNVYGTQTLLDSWNTTVLDPEGRTVLIDNEKGAAALKYLYDLLRADLAQVTGVIPDGANNAFLAGQVLFNTTFMPVIPWILGEVKKAGKFEGGATLMPKGPKPDGRNGGVLNPHYLGMNADTKNGDMAWEYLKWFTGPEMSQPLWDKGLVTALVETWKKAGNLDQWPGYKEAASLLSTIKLSAVPWNFRGAELYDALQQGMDRAWTGKMDFKAALDDTAKSMRKVLEQPAG